MSRRLEGKSCIVTGAGGGIGRAVAIAFAAEGARVVVNDVSRDAADGVVAELTESGAEAVAHYEPIGSVAAAESVVDTAFQTFGRLDVLVNNAGILRDRMLHNMSEEEFDPQGHVGLWPSRRGPLAPARQEGGGK
jgi:NAD(P)-dependent dehydrogenase (short-subunit alcohol dehydrogenase family)